ncbi:TPA: hypothetical protein ACGTQP_001295 [Salmonella enterica]|nr:hypothetical protein [Salmonella enterica subsp. enterica]EDT1338932.1 hypothetical protein [Salmonella enterica subsp. enterica serovar Enteritidis]HAU7790862.1 hypothetical protein [Salmonella enterica subsp. enterica serovar Wangata]
MSVDTGDVMAQRETMLHTDLHIAVIHHALNSWEPVSRQHYVVDCGVAIPEKRRTSLSGFRRCADCQLWRDVQERKG